MKKHKMEIKYPLPDNVLYAEPLPGYFAELQTAEGMMKLVVKLAPFHGTRADAYEWIRIWYKGITGFYPTWRDYESLSHSQGNSIRNQRMNR